MKRSTAVKRIKAHLNRYKKDLRQDGEVVLGLYEPEPCPLCRAVVGEDCPEESNEMCLSSCVRFPGVGRVDDLDRRPCLTFTQTINCLETVPAKLKQIKKLDAALDKWEKSQ